MGRGFAAEAQARCSSNCQAGSSMRPASSARSREAKRAARAKGPERERERVGILDSFQAVGQRGQGVFVKTIICCLDPIPQPTSRASPPLLQQQPLAVGWGTANHAPACGLRAPNRQPTRQSRRCLHPAQTSSLPLPSRPSQPPSQCGGLRSDWQGDAPQAPPALLASRS